MVNFSCPSCQRGLNAPEAMAGTAMECPHCQQPLQVPAEVRADAEQAAGPLASPAAPAMRFETVAFTADGGFNPHGLAITYGLALVAGVGAGWLASFIGQWFYLILIFPFVMGIIVAGIGAVGVHMGKVRHPLLAGLGGLLGGIAAILSMHYFEYQRAMDELEKQNPGIRKAWAEEGMGFVDFVKIQANNGVRIGKVGRGDGMNLGTVGSYIYWSLEMLLVAGIGFAGMLGSASDPFCLNCRNWKSSRPLGRIAIPRDAALAAIQSGDVVQLAEHDFSAADGTLALTVAECKQCGQEATIEVKLEEVTKDAKGKESTKLLAHVTYPGHALPVLEALAARRQPPTPTA